MVDKHPIVLDVSTPVGVYMEDFSLPKVINTVEYFDKITRSACAREYLNFSIAHRLISQFQRQVDIYQANERIDKLLKNINRTLKEHKYNDIQDL